jgi:hypothetical protein
VNTVVCGVLTRTRGVQTRMLGSRRRQGLTSAAGVSAWCLCRAHRTWPTRMESGCHQILGETRSCQLLETQHDSVPRTKPRLISVHLRLISVLRAKSHPPLFCCLSLWRLYLFIYLFCLAVNTSQYVHNLFSYTHSHTEAERLETTYERPDG